MNQQNGTPCSAFDRVLCADGRECAIIPVELLRLSTIQGFMYRWAVHLHDLGSPLQAYEQTELECVRVFGCQRYNNYQSFVAAKKHFYTRKSAGKLINYNVLVSLKG